MTEHWDGTESMPWVDDDGGRAKAGYKGRAGDCVARSIAIASGKPYAEVYDALAAGNGSQRITKHTKRRGASARNGVYVRRKWFKDYMASLGFEWVPTMRIGQGCKVHLLKGELPAGRLVVSLSKHYTAVIDGVIHDTFDPHWATLTTENGERRMAHRCVYGYWRFARIEWKKLPAYFTADSIARGIFRPDSDTHCTLQELRWLYSDAQFYVDASGPDQCPAGLKTSARAVVTAIEKRHPEVLQIEASYPGQENEHGN